MDAMEVTIKMLAAKEPEELLDKIDVLLHRVNELSILIIHEAEAEDGKWSKVRSYACEIKKLISGDGDS